MIETAISSGAIAPRSRPAGALSFARRSGATPRCREDGLESIGLLAAADERNIVGVNRERRLQRGLVATALRRDHDEPPTGFRHRQGIPFDAALDLAEGGLLGRRRAHCDVEADAPAEIGDRDRHRTSRRRSRSAGAAKPARRRCPWCPRSGTCSWRSARRRALRPPGCPGPATHRGAVPTGAAACRRRAPRAPP